MSRTIAFVSRLPVPVRRMLKKFPGARGVQASLVGSPAGPDPEPGELRPVVYLPTWARWDEMRQRPQYLLEALARAGHDVYFVDPREPRARTADGVRIVSSLSPVPRSHVILYVHFAPLRAMFDKFDDAVILYDILDDLKIYDDDEVGMPAESRVRHHHPLVLNDADLVMASAPPLVAKHRSERDGILLVENGVDPQRFHSERPVPEVLQGMTGPIVGYHGAVARWFNFDLYRQLAERLPDSQFVIVGPVDDDAESGMEAIAELSNVRYLGAVSSDEIPDFVASFDVGIIPFVVDDLTRGVSPLKMYEYLAARVPVVSTPLPVCVDHPAVRTALDVDEFAFEVVAAVADHGTPDFDSIADAAADAASWANRVETIRRRLREHGRLRVPE